MIEGDTKAYNKINGVLNVDFTALDGNELFQEFLLGRRQYPIVQLMKEEDREPFLRLVEEYAEAGFETVARILDQNEEYRWYYVYLKKCAAEEEQASYHINMRNVCHMEECIENLEQASGQYGRFLSMQNQMYFLYLYKNGRICIFWMDRDRLHTVVNEMLDKWEEEICDSGHFADGGESAFHMVCEEIRKGSERFVKDIMTSAFSTDDVERLYRFRGMTWRRLGRLEECYGTIQLLDKSGGAGQQDRPMIDKTAEILHVYDLLEENGIGALEESMSFIGEAYGLDQINIFKNQDLLLWKSWGCEAFRQNSAAYVLGEDGINNFNEYKVDVCSDLSARADKHPKACEHLDRLGVKSYMQYIMGERQQIAGLISYEGCKQKREWTEEDVHNLTLLSRFIENAVLKGINR